MKRKYQVFVSSTYSDLQLERQVSVEAILTAGHIPAGMELFSAGDETQLEIINRWIDESDIYMLLVGGRYGSIEPKSQLSYTELEYRYAIEKGKPCFAVIMSENYLDEKVKNVGKQVLELTETKKYEEFRNLVLSKISKYFNNKDQLQLAIMQSLLDIQNRYFLTGWVRGDEVVDATKVLNQVTELAERNKELEKELDELRSLSMETNVQRICNGLSKEARVILLCAFEDRNCEIMVERSISYLEITMGSIILPDDKSPRTIANYEAAISELVGNNIIKPVHQRSSYTTYTITKNGFEIIDALKPIV